MFFWQRPFSSYAITYAAFLAQGEIRSQLQCEVLYPPPPPPRHPPPLPTSHPTHPVTSPNSAPGSCVFAALRSAVSSPSLLAVWILSSLTAICSLLEQTGRSQSHDKLRFFPLTFEDVFPQGVRNDRDPDIPSLSCFATFPWKRGQMWFAARDRWLLLWLIWFWLLMESGLCGFVMPPLLIQPASPPSPKQMYLKKKTNESHGEERCGMLSQRLKTCDLSSSCLPLSLVLSWFLIFRMRALSC